MIATITTHFNASAETVWNLLKKKDTFRYITRGFMGFTGIKHWPEEFSPGLEVQARCILFHVFPIWKHTLYVDRIDRDSMELYSTEKGGIIRTWNHLIQIKPTTENRCRYMDRVEIEAGFFTIIIWLYAHIFYRYRHLRWKRMLRMIPK